MASIPLAFDSHPGWTPLPRSRSQASPGYQYHSRMPPSRETTSPHGFRPGQTPPRALSRLSPASPGRESMQALYPVDHSCDIVPEYLAEEQQSTMSTSSQTRRQSQRHHQKSRPGSRRSRRNADHSSLLAIGSWSNQITSHEDRHRDHHALSSNRSESAKHEDESSYKHAPYDDFILFPGENQDAYEDVSAYTEQPSAPLAPRIPRLRTPDTAPLSTDVQFFPCLGDEADEDRINEAWYLAGRDRVLSQVEEAMAYMSMVGGR